MLTAVMKSNGGSLVERSLENPKMSALGGVWGPAKNWSQNVKKVTKSLLSQNIKYKNDHFLDLYR